MRNLSFTRKNNVFSQHFVEIAFTDNFSKTLAKNLTKQTKLNLMKLISLHELKNCNNKLNEKQLIFQ